MAPALAGILQPILDSAGGKTAEAIGSKFVSTFAWSGVILTPEEATQLGKVILAVSLPSAARTANHLYQTFPLTPYFAISTSRPTLFQILLRPRHLQAPLPVP